MFRPWVLAIVRELSLVCANYVSIYMSEIPRWLKLLWWLSFTILKISIIVKIEFKCSTKLFYVDTSVFLVWIVTFFSSGIWQAEVRKMDTNLGNCTFFKNKKTWNNRTDQFITPKYAIYFTGTDTHNSKYFWLNATSTVNQYRYTEDTSSSTKNFTTIF